jgi:hypothetical protein
LLFTEIFYFDVNIMYLQHKNNIDSTDVVEGQVIGLYSMQETESMNDVLTIGLFKRCLFSVF